MYQAAIDAFFRDGQVQRLFQKDVLAHNIVYIQPTFSTSTTSISNDIVEMILARTKAQGLAQVQSEQSGGAVIALSAIGTDPNAATVYTQGGPTIQLSLWISGTSCGSSIAIGYLLTTNGREWQAQQYLIAVC